MVVSWARAIMSISKKAWTFPGRPYYYIFYFQKLIESPTTVRQKEERDIPGPRDNLEGKSCLAGSSLVPWPCHSLGTSWWFPRGHIGPPGSPVWGRAALQVPLSSRDLVTDWAHPGRSRHKSSSSSYLPKVTTILTSNSINCICLVLDSK